MILLPIITTAYLILLLLYGLLLRRYNKHLKAIVPYKPTHTSTLHAAVVIPARNEEQNIQSCLKPLLQQNFPRDRYQVIVVDDHSEDNTAQVAGKMADLVIRMQDHDPRTNVAFKKAAIRTGIESTDADVIITTDADCKVPHQWIHMMTSLMQEQDAVMVSGPVRMVPGNTFLSRFQSLDFAILQGITAASVHSGYHDLASGANLAYRRDAFWNVGGFDGIDDIATGDDMLLMQKFSDQFPGRIGYLYAQQAIIDTKPEATWRSFFRQRIRWASKARRYRDKKIFRILLLVYLLNLTLLLMMATAFVSPLHFTFCLSALFLKTMVEWGFVSRILNFFSLQELLTLFPVAQPIHVAYTVLSGTFGQLGKVEWKGRKVK